jgi:hypothetical protein
MAGTMAARRGAPPLFSDAGGPSSASSATAQETSPTPARIFGRVGAVDRRPGIRHDTWSPDALGSLQPTSEDRPSASGRRRTPVHSGHGRRWKRGREDGTEHHHKPEDPPPRTTADRPPSATTTPASPPAGGCGGSKGQLRVRETPTATSTYIHPGIWAIRGSRPRVGHSQAGRPTGRKSPARFLLPQIQKSVGPPPPTSEKSKKTP